MWLLVAILHVILSRLCCVCVCRAERSSAKCDAVCADAGANYRQCEIGSFSMQRRCAGPRWRRRQVAASTNMFRIHKAPLVPCADPLETASQRAHKTVPQCVYVSCTTHKPPTLAFAPLKRLPSTLQNRRALRLHAFMFTAFCIQHIC